MDAGKAQPNNGQVTPANF